MGPEADLPHSLTTALPVPKACCSQLMLMWRGVRVRQEEQGFPGFKAQGLGWPLSAAFLAGHLNFQILVFAFKMVIIIYLLFLLHGPPTGSNELKMFYNF